MSAVIEFRRPKQGQKIIRAECVKLEGWKRRRWVVMIHNTDGSWDWHRAGGKKGALGLAAILQTVHAKRIKEIESMALHPLGAKLLSISTPDLEIMQNLIRGTLELRASL
jgi:hypothetical protein